MCDFSCYISAPALFVSSLGAQHPLVHMHEKFLRHLHFDLCVDINVVVIVVVRVKEKRKKKLGLDPRYCECHGASSS